MCFFHSIDKAATGPVDSSLLETVMTPDDHAAQVQLAQGNLNLRVRRLTRQDADQKLGRHYVPELAC